MSHPTEEQMLYAARDHYSLSPHFERHMLALTGESLTSKSAIAGELAHRDAEIQRLREQIEQLKLEHRKELNQTIRDAREDMADAYSQGERAGRDDGEPYGTY